MPGLAAYAAAGALVGWGKGIEERALEKLRAQYKAEDRAARLEDAQTLAAYKQDLKDASKGATGGGGGGGGRRSSGGGGGSTASGGSEAGPLYSVKNGPNGTQVGFSRALGRWVDVPGPDGKPMPNDPEKGSVSRGKNADTPDVPDYAPPAPAAPVGAPPRGAVDLLKSDPSPAAKREFDEMFGIGSAARILGG